MTTPFVFTAHKDQSTGVEFIHTSYEGAGGQPDTDPFITLIDQRFNAAAARFDAHWLEVMSRPEYIGTPGVRAALDEAATLHAQQTGEHHPKLQEKPATDFARIEGARKHASFLLRTAGTLEKWARYNSEHLHL